MNIKKDKISAKILFLSLIALAISLPLAEAPKNLFSLTALISGCIVFFQYNLKLTFLQKILIAWLLVAALTSLHAKYILGLSAKGITDIFRFTVIGLVSTVLIQINYKPKMIVLALITSAVVASMTAGYNLYTGLSNSINLKSVGHVNQSAIYATLMFGLSISYFLYKKQPSIKKVLLLTFTIVLATTIIFTDSRAAIGAMLLVTAIVTFSFFIRDYKKTALISISVVLVSAAILHDKINTVVNKHNEWSKRYFQESYAKTPRGQINTISKLVIKENSLLGIGYGNFTRYSKNNGQDLVLKNDLNSSIDSAFFGFHPHNMYYETFASLGLIFSLIFVFFWLYIVSVLWKFKPGNSINISWHWMALLTTVITNLSIGLFNNPMHHESAILSMIIIGITVQKLTSSEHAP